MIGIAAIKNRRLEMFTGFQCVAKIKWIESAGYSHRIQLGALDADSPGSGPRERSKPDFPVLLVRKSSSHCRLAFVAGNREPRIGLMPGGSAPAFHDARAAANGFLIQRPLAGPAACQIAQGIARWRQGPLRGGSLFDHNGLPITVFDVGRTGENTSNRVDGIMQRHINL